MREIKFRAWDEESKTMFTRIGISGSFFAFEGEESLKLHDNIPLMQYTGLKDKNGKEIYEGDIVHWWNGLSGPGKVGQVIWDDKGQWLFKENYIDYPIGIYPEKEVIGNIYENPELLK